MTTTKMIEIAVKLTMNWLGGRGTNYHMKTKIEERKGNNEVLIFMEAESVEDAAMILRITGSMKQGNEGHCSFYDNEIAGWIRIPLVKNKHHNIDSGKTST